MKVLRLSVFAMLFAGVFSAGAVHAQSANELKMGFYGELVFNSFYTNEHLKNETNDKFLFNLSDSSKLGITFDYGQLGSVFEFGSASDSIIRLAYAEYRFANGGKFLLGQNENMAFYNFGQVSDNGNALINFGTLGDVRRPMLKYSIHGFNVALISGEGLNIAGQDESIGYFETVIGEFNALGANVKQVSHIPRVEVSYDIESDIFNGSIFGSYAAYLLTSEVTGGTKKNYNINTFSAGFGGQMTLGDAFIDMTAYYGMNMFLTGALTNSSMPALTLNGDHSLSVKNVQSVGGALGFGYNINEMFTPQVGAGYSVSFDGPFSGNDEAWGVFANVKIQVNEWLSFTPEVAYTSNYNDIANNARAENFHVGFQTVAAF